MYNLPFKVINKPSCCRIFYLVILSFHSNTQYLNIYKTYLIIEDDVDDQEFLRQALIKNEPTAQCKMAFNGKEAMVILRSNCFCLPDAIFMDLNMPRFNGRECLAELKRTSLFQNIPVIVYTTSSDKKEIFEILQMGAYCFMTKKSDLKELRNELSVITSYLQTLAPGLDNLINGVPHLSLNL